MAVPDNDVKKLYQQINELKAIVSKYEGRLEAVEKYIVKLNEYGKKRDKQLGNYMRNQSVFFNELFDSVETVLSIVKGFLP
ncbi:MAG: hypothetical protein KME29_03850 [Calothrix sp. FI2-JRJ7]|jgi:peptidoglycan hydrolase CwlO-like protein|nr:hypothetical protein [Calothrix sp. FI2-JRJ7]MBW4598754.1 hypothetical protein [Calothrix sp. FI2-JRJ7]